MSDFTAEMSIGDTDIPMQAFQMGLLTGLMLPDVDESACDGCSCGLAEGPETEEVTIPASLDLGVAVRQYLERYDIVDDDDFVKKVEICPNEVVAHVET